MLKKNKLPCLTLTYRAQRVGWEMNRGATGMIASEGVGLGWALAVGMCSGGAWELCCGLNKQHFASEQNRSGDTQDGSRDPSLVEGRMASC